MISIGTQIEEAKKDLEALERQMIKGPKGFPNDVAHYRREIKKAIIATLEIVQEQRRAAE